ncbi:hemagglutinin-like protein, partial [Phyllobacterium sp. YR531]|uniref:hemagglutinin-like protein n=1 Tax=Phyllobacterium sp. YR531 TaxID=1144343 RepID=UPI00026F98EF
MTKVTAGIFSTNSSPKAARFAGNWLAGAAESRSARRRLNAILRLACRTLGLKRGKGLGMLGVAAAVVVGLASPVMAQTTAGPVIASSPQIGLEAKPVPAGSFRLPDGFAFVDATNRSSLLEFTVHAGAIIRSSGQVQHAPFQFVPTNVILEKDYTFLSGEGVFPAGTTFDGPVTMAAGTETGYKTWFPKGTVFPLGTVRDSGKNPIPGITPGVPTSEAVVVNGLIFPKKDKLQPGLDTRFSQIKINTDANSKPAQTSTDVPGDIAIGSGAIAKGKIGADVPNHPEAKYHSATAIGKNASAEGDDAVAIGSLAWVKGDEGLALGGNAVVDKDNSVALGAGANAFHKNSVALGHVSVTEDVHSVGNDVTLNGKSYTIGSHGMGVVSIGSKRFGPSRTRQIINVAPGVVAPGSTDATNGEQLHVAYDSINELGKTVKDQGDRLTAAEGTIATQGSKIGALDKTVTDQGDRLTTAEGALKTQSDTLITHGKQIGDLKQELNAGKTGLVQNDPTGKEISIGGDSTAKTVDFSGKTPQLDANGNPVKDANGNTVMIDADRTLTGVAPGVKPNDVVNKGQLDGVEKQAAAAQEAADKVKLTADASAKQIGNLETSVKDQGDALNVHNKQIGALQKNALLHDGTAYNANHNGTKSRIINVENGVDVSDAATVGQLDDLKQSLSAGKTGLVQNDPTGKEISIGGDSTAKTVDFGGKTPQLDANGKPVLDANGKPVLVDADRTLTGVAPGVNANDAVNKGQLDAVVEASKAIGGSIAGALGGGATIDKDGKVTLPTLSLTSLGNDASGKPVTQPGTIVDGLNAVDAVVKGQGDRLATAEGALTAQGNKLTAAENTLKTQGDALAIHDKQIVALAKNTLLHDGTAYNANHNGAKNRIINVENGVDVSDAATVGQLDDLKQSLSAGKTGLVQNDPTGKEISIGGDSTAKTVDFGGKTPQLDANGNPVKDANGNTVMIDADRTLTGVAPGVNANDAVNKTQLDGVEKQAAAAQEAADKVKLTADASAKKIDALDTTVKDQGGRLTATEGALTTQGKQIGDLETSVKDQGGRLTTAENTLKTQG